MVVILCCRKGLENCPTLGKVVQRSTLEKVTGFCQELCRYEDKLLPVSEKEWVSAPLLDALKEMERHLESNTQLRKDVQNPPHVMRFGHIDRQTAGFESLPALPAEDYMTLITRQLMATSSSITDVYDRSLKAVTRACGVRYP